MTAFAQALSAALPAGVTVDLGGSSILHRTSVEYPGFAIEKGIQGSVTVEATLDAAGNVSDARVLSGPAELRKVALQSVLQWHFAPATAGVARQVNITFNLEGARNQEAESRVNRVSSAEAERKQAARKQEPGQEGEAQARERISRETTSFIEAQIEELRARQGQTVQAQQSPEAPDKLKRQLAELESNLAAARRADLLTGIAGGALGSIEVVGLPDSMRNQLLSQLPVHLGDTLTPDLLERIGREARRFDGHLEVSLTRQGDGDGVSLRIAAPDTRSFVTIRRK